MQDHKPTVTSSGSEVDGAALMDDVFGTGAKITAVMIA